MSSTGQSRGDEDPGPGLLGWERRPASSTLRELFMVQSFHPPRQSGAGDVVMSDKTPTQQRWVSPSNAPAWPRGQPLAGPLVNSPSSGIILVHRDASKGWKMQVSTQGYFKLAF